jgi:hypothetical protein
MIILTCCCCVLCIDCNEVFALEFCPSCKIDSKSFNTFEFKIDEKLSNSDKKAGKLISRYISNKINYKDMKIVDIINGKFSDRKLINLKISTLNNGNIFIEQDKMDKKIFLIVCSNMSKLLSLQIILKDIFKDKKIVIFDDLFEHKDEDIILLMAEYAIGINMQYVSDLIIYHTFADPLIEAQVIARVQRFGRKFSATLHYIKYIHEK